MKKSIATLVMWCIGWKLSVDADDHRKNHCVLVAAPHTSNWDLVYALAALWKLKIPVRFLIKDYYTKNLLFGWFFRWLGGIGVDRSQRCNLVEYAASLLKENDNLSILLAPEGTRKRVNTWKSGFYKIASSANVPIGMAFLDFKEKKAGLYGFVEPGLSYSDTLMAIREAYKNVHAAKPENWNPDFDIE
ncbi:MAG: 1-acyl-sn-glycerol-3-phosphate acyltransferase [Flavobacteriales bacterium]|nr:1-acyl-sn-glycerol-3-phosphate acyltransferase [Flavobacteriales bacterium]